MPLIQSESSSGGGFASVPLGTYEVRWNGFDTRDATGNPIFKAPKNPTPENNSPYAICLLTVMNGDHAGEDVKLFVRPDNLNLWAHQFARCDYLGGDLVEFEALMRERFASNVQVNCTEKGTAKSLAVPAKPYYAFFAGFTRRDSQNRPIWREEVRRQKDKPDQMARKVYGQVEIASGEYRGVLVPWSQWYTITWHQPGEVVDKQVLPSGGHTYHPNSTLLKWLNAFAGDGMQALASEDFTFGDPENILPEIEEILYRHRLPVNVSIDPSGWLKSSVEGVTQAPDEMQSIIQASGFTPGVPLSEVGPRRPVPVASRAFTPTPAAAPAARPSPPPTQFPFRTMQPPPPATSQQPVLGPVELAFKEAIEKVATAQFRPEPFVRNGTNLALTTDGIAFAKEVIGPLCDQTIVDWTDDPQFAGKPIPRAKGFASVRECPGGMEHLTQALLALLAPSEAQQALPLEGVAEAIQAF